MLPGQENKEGSVLLCAPDLLLASPSSIPYSQHHPYKPLPIFHQMNYESQKYVEQLTSLKLQCFFLQKQAQRFLTYECCIADIFLS